MNRIIDAFLTEFEGFIEFIPRLLTAIVVVLIIYFIGRFLAGITERILRRTSMHETYHLFFRKLIIGIAVFIGIIVFLNMIGYRRLATSLVAGGGLTAVIVGFAFKDIGENFLAGFFLAFSRPFNAGDVIESGEIVGIVKSIHLRHTHIRTYDGCDIFIPNARLFTQPLLNYTLDGLLRSDFTVGVDYKDDALAAVELMLNTTKNSRGVLKKPAAFVEIKNFHANHVELQVFFWISSNDQAATMPVVRTGVMNNCRLALIDKGYTFSSEVTTAVDVNPVDVIINKKKNE